METQTNFQKGNLYFIIAIIVGVFAIGAVGFASWKYFGESSELEKETQPVYSLEKEKTVPEVKKQEEIIPSGKVDKISSIKILSPNGGEKLIVGKTYNITWECPDNAEIDVMDIYIQDKRLSDKGIITPIGGSIINCSAEKYSWQIKDISPGENCFKVQLRHVAGSVPLIDESDNYFSITENKTPFIKVLSPNGGEVWKVGSTQTIQWNTQNIPLTDKIAIHIRKIRSPASSNEGQECDPIIFTELKNDGKEDWVISEYSEGNYIIEIVSYESIPITKSISDESDAYFQIVN